MTGLTRSQWDLLAYLAGFIRDHGYSPTYEQMRVALGYASRSSVHRVMSRLQERGYVTREHGHACSVLMTPSGADVAEAFMARLHSREMVAA